MRKARWCRNLRCFGFTIIELMMAIAMVGVLIAIALPIYSKYTERQKTQQAVQDIAVIAAILEMNWQDAHEYPDTLDSVGVAKLDPWGHPYQYLNLQTVHGHGQARKDRSLVPINTDFDLYSMGPDGRSVSPLTAAMSRDDIVRANNGKFIGVAADY